LEFIVSSSKKQRTFIILEGILVFFDEGKLPLVCHDKKNNLQSCKISKRRRKIRRQL